MLVCYYFPPLGMGGVQRPIMLSSHLANLGWNVSILTVKPFHYPAFDYSLAKKLPRDVRVLRATCIEQQLLKRIVPGAVGMRAETGEPPPGSRISEWVLVPDNKMLTIGAFLRRIETVLRIVRPSAVITSSPPPSIHIVGWYLRKYFGLKWIADYRDVWFSQSQVSCRTRVHGRIHRYLQKAFVDKADRTVVVTDAHLQFLRAAYGENADSLCLIPNGYDEQMFAGTQSTPSRNGICRIGYCGTLNRLTYVPGMFELLIAASGSHPISIDLCGVVSADVQVDIDEIDPEGRTVHRKGYMDHAKAIDFRMKCDANLVTLAPGLHLDMTVPGKTYETLRTPRHVIGIVPRDSSTWSLLSRFDSVTLVDASNLASSRDSVAELIRSGRVDSRKREGIDQFSWGHLAAKYDRLLMEVAM